MTGGRASSDEWLENSDAVVLKADRKDALVALKLQRALAITLAAEKARAPPA